MTKPVPFCGQVIVKLSDGSKVTIYGSKLTSEGLHVESDYKSDKKTQLEIMFSVLLGEKAKMIEATVEVIGCTYQGSKQNYRIEFKFKSIKDDGREIIERYIASRANTSPSYVR